MNAPGGVITALVAWTAAAPACTSDWKQIAAGYPMAVIASYLPDLDHNRSTAGQASQGASTGIRWLFGGHRMGTHSLLAVALCWLAVWWFSLPSDQSVADWMLALTMAFPAATMGVALANAAATGWLSHIWCDLLTVQGVGLAWPLTRRKVHIANFRTGTKAENDYVWVMRGLLAVVILLHLNNAIGALA